MTERRIDIRYIGCISDCISGIESSYRKGSKPCQYQAIVSFNGNTLNDKYNAERPYRTETNSKYIINDLEVITQLNGDICVFITF